MHLYSIVVCYHPEVEPLVVLCASLTAHGGNVVLVDNTETPSLERIPLPERCVLKTLGRNTGLAHAQNVGIDIATAAGADVLAFFDQDSTVPESLLPTLVSHLRTGTADVVAPLCFDIESGREIPSVRLSRCGVARIVRGRAHSVAPYPVHLIISSGTVATRQAFEAAGRFDAELFIDYVDHEWCCRCLRAGIPIRIVPSAIMRHRLGSRWIRLPLITVIVHPPARCYYQLRNPLLLLRNRNVPVAYSLAQAALVLLNRVLLIVMTNNKLAYAKSCLAGLRDGILGRSGARPS